MTTSYKAAVLGNDTQTPEFAERRQRELDAQVEDLTRRLVEVINRAGAEHRQDLRAYAIDLLRDGTEIDVPDPRPATTRKAGGNPLGMALLLFVVALPMCLLFTPVGLALLAISLVLGVWGVAAILLGR